MSPVRLAGRIVVNVGIIISFLPIFLSGALPVYAIGNAALPDPGNVCNYMDHQSGLPFAADTQKCQSCFNNGGTWTAVGCIGESTDPKESFSSTLRTLMDFAIGIGGGIAFMLILVSGFQTITSAGNPEKLHEAKELMTAAISGLLLIIFSTFILEIIGVHVLGPLGGFGGPIIGGR